MVEKGTFKRPLRLTERIFILAKFDAIRLYMIMALAFVTEQLLSRFVEIVIWGAAFVHVVDVIVLVVAWAGYAVLCWEMASYKESLEAAVPSRMDRK